MKIAFSTLGCPGWSWDDILSTAKDFGFDGIELRGVESEIYVPKAEPFLEKNLEATKGRLGRLGLEIPALTSACYLFEKDRAEDNIREGKEYIDLASKLGTPYVRVLGDRNPEPGGDVDLSLVADNLGILSDYARGKAVTILVETNGVLADSEKLAGLVGRVGRSNVGVLWDIHHPYRYFGETAEKTYGTLKDHIRYVHIKDSAVENGKVKYKMMGYGDVPVNNALKLLKENGFEGYVSLEWVKRWNMDLEDPGVVFSHFVNYVRRVLE